MDVKVCREIVDHLLRVPNPTIRDVSLAKIRVAGRYGLGEIPSNAELISVLAPSERGRLIHLLRRKRVRTASGVTVIAAMTRPYPCPKDEPCAYCPGGPSQGVPQSYTGREPAAMRGIQNDYDPYWQVRRRIEQLEAIGHTVDKVELIIMGGTFLATPLKYQRYFVKGCLEAVVGRRIPSLEDAKREAERSRIRNVGITVETRPDWSKEIHVDRMLSMGVTRVELGVQNIYDDIYERVDRGHMVQDVVEATRILKDSGLKVLYHMMPGLPGSDFERDLAAFKTIFTDPRFKPDMIKIYPCLVLKGTKLHEWWKLGQYEPYTTEEAVHLISEVKRFVPEWVRVMRVQRDIPSYLIEAGVDKSNLRQLVHERLNRLGFRCRCIRCREVGLRMLSEGVKPDLENVEVLKRSYWASEGEEIFISVEDTVNDILIGYLRLRFPSEHAHRPEIADFDASLIRELRVCGHLVPVGVRPVPEKEAYQHMGYGAELLSEAEEVSRAKGVEKILVTSALGTKRYYKRFGYKPDGPYMSKRLK